MVDCLSTTPLSETVDPHAMTFILFNIFNQYYYFEKYYSNQGKRYLHAYCIILKYQINSKHRLTINQASEGGGVIEQRYKVISFNKAMKENHRNDWQ